MLNFNKKYIEYTNEYFNSFKQLIINHYYGIKSLYLFVIILFQLKHLFQHKLFNNEEYLEKIKNNILNCGCISIKFTQWIVSKLKGSDNYKDYENIINIFEELFDNCKYHDFEYTNNIFKKSIKKELKDVFDMDEFKVIASGSIGQVYKTRFIDDKFYNSNLSDIINIDSDNFNKDVILKVRHPYIDYIKSYQMLLIYILVIMQKIDYFKVKYHLHFNFFDFIDNINNQIDFNIEAFNCNKMYNSYKNNELVVIPKIYNFNKDIIISSYENGEYIFDISEYQKCKAAINVLCLVNKMCLVDNFMHGDMHIKNWKVRPFKNTYQIILYDFGICFNGPSLDFNKKLWRYGEEQNIKNIINIFIDNNIHYSSKEELTEKLYETFRTLCQEPFNMNIVFNKLIIIFSNYNLIINNLFLNVIIFLCLIEDIFKKTNIICQDNKIIGINGIIKNQKLDMLTFCKTYNCYTELIPILEEDLNYFQNKEDNSETSNNFKTNMFDSYKLSNFNFSNPDELEDL